nr:UTRA domain-containing protein [Paenibacillus lemnae]
MLSNFQILGFHKTKSTEFLAQLFGANAGEHVFEITRLRFIGDELFAWERAYTPSSVMEGATMEELQSDGLYATIYRHSNLMAEEAEVEAQAVNCPGDIAEFLQIKKNAAVLHLTRLTSAQDHCIEFCESYIRSEKYKYKYKQTLRKKNY